MTLQPCRRFSVSLPRALPIGLVLLIPFAFSCASRASAQEGELERRFHEPVAQLYTQIVETESQGVRTLYVSGQVGSGETLEAQSRAAFGNLKRRLEAVGAGVDDIVKLTTYVVDWSSEKADAAFAGFYEIFAGQLDRVPAHTLVGVQALYSPNARIEVEAVAVVAAE